NNLRGRIAQDPYLSPGERMRLGAEDRAIRTQEQIDAFRHGGHITRSEQYRLNTEENRLRHQIYRDSRY
ncbi:MAG TPA: hypothetical protein V6C72_06845, partial [Chroococcales cyanobacterium]